VIYGLENQILLADVDINEVRTSIASHFSNKMFISQNGRLIIAPYEIPCETMRIYIRSPKKETLVMELYSIDTIAIVRKRISLAIGIRLSDILLVTKGKQIKDEMMVKSVLKE
jgi:hypothetical protein